MKCTKEDPEWMTDKEILEGMSDGELGVQITIADIERNHSECKSIEYDAAQNCIWVERAGFSSYPILDINNPSDIMPLVFEAGISLIKDINKPAYYACSGYELSSVYCSYHNRDPDIESVINSAKPLRAAAIAYLLAVGWKND